MNNKTNIKKEGNQRIFFGFFILFFIAIIARYIIYKLRPGTFSVILFKPITTSEIVTLVVALLIAITERIKYFKINLGMYLIALAAYLIKLIINFGKHDPAYIMNASMLLVVVFLMLYPIKKLKEQK